jgi:hypothetical protein
MMAIGTYGLGFKEPTLSLAFALKSRSSYRPNGRRDRRPQWRLRAIFTARSIN